MLEEGTELVGMLDDGEELVGVLVGVLDDGEELVGVLDGLELLGLLDGLLDVGAELGTSCKVDEQLRMELDGSFSQSMVPGFLPIRT